MLNSTFPCRCRGILKIILLKWLPHTFEITATSPRGNELIIPTVFQQPNVTYTCKAVFTFMYPTTADTITGDPLHSRALAHSRAPLFTQPCPHCSHSRAPGEQWARLCVFTLQGCVQAARLCRGSPVTMLCSLLSLCWSRTQNAPLQFFEAFCCFFFL